MNHHLTAAQQAWLQAELEARQRRLDAQLSSHQGGASRVEHAHEVLAQDRESTSQHAMEREVDLAMSDFDLGEIGAISRALLRIRDQRYGLCGDCGEPIPFDRLKAEPQAERCRPCASRHEASARHR